MVIHWTAALSLGIEELDAQHRELYRRAARVLQELNGGQPADVAAAVDALHEHAAAGFAIEEGWMRDAGFAGLARHAAEHARFLGDLEAVSADHRRRARAPSAMRVSRWLSEWLQLHVTGTDAELAAFLSRTRKKGARSA